MPSRVGYLLAVLIVIAMVGHAGVVETDHATVPPIQVRDMLDTLLHPIDPSALKAYLEDAPSPVEFDMFAGDNNTLERLNPPKGGALAVASGYPVEVDASEVFAPTSADGSWTIYMGAVKSTDALALRVQVRLDTLGDFDELWCIDPEHPRAFGPYRREDDDPDGVWLPTIEGDTVALMLRTADDSLPELKITTLSHFFRPLRQAVTAKSLLPCHVNVACIEDETVQSISTGVGYIVTTGITNDSFICTGTLINTPQTAELEPYFITANHCVGSQREARQVDVIWDFRAPNCDSNAAPPLSSLPRSRGAQMLHSSSSLDISLLELNNVPPGSRGRTYVGYTTRTPSVGEDVLTLHHPRSSHIRTTSGYVEAINVFSFPWQGQIRARWEEGVTEAGSSGGGLFLAESGYRLAGALSNGPTHSCSTSARNTDNFASFARFYDQAEPWLKGNPPPAQMLQCPAQIALKDHPAALAGLRHFRDERLDPLPGGRLAIGLYYRAAPHLAGFMNHSPSTRRMVQWLAKPFALVSD